MPERFIRLTKLRFYHSWELKGSMRSNPEVLTVNLLYTTLTEAKPRKPIKNCIPSFGVLQTYWKQTVAEQLGTTRLRHGEKWAKILAYRGNWRLRAEIRVELTVERICPFLRRFTRLYGNHPVRSALPANDEVIRSLDSQILPPPNKRKHQRPQIKAHPNHNRSYKLNLNVNSTKKWWIAATSIVPLSKAMGT